MKHILKRMASGVLSLLLLISLFSTATANDIGPIEAGALFQCNYVVIGTYTTEEEKQAAIQNILAADPTAAIFTSIEDCDVFRTSLANATMEYSEVLFARSVQRTQKISLKIGVSAYVNLYYDYIAQKGGTVLSVTSPYTTFTGFTFGNSYEQNYLSVKKSGTTKIVSDLGFSIHHYLLIDGLIRIGTSNCRWKFTHNVTANTVTKVRIY